MSNRLSMAQTQAIQALAATGKSHRAISKALGVDRGTVAKTLSQIQNQPPVWEAPTGFPDGHQVAASELETSLTGIAVGASSSGNSDDRQLVLAASVNPIAIRSFASLSRV